MFYPFLTLPDETEIVHSELKDDDTVEVYIETPIDGGFKNAYCTLPNYRWHDVTGYSSEEIQSFQEIIESTAHLILEYSQTGGFGNAANL